MRLTGEYLVPHLNGQVYSHKPPLQFWAMAGAATLRGRLDETAARLPAAGAPFWRPAAARSGPADVQPPRRLDRGDRLPDRLEDPLAGPHRTDRHAAGGAGALAVWCWWRALHDDRPAFATLGFAAAGLATLAKGPVGLLPPLLAVLAFLVWHA